jgi:alkylhydroperoxidase family enzyme
MLVAHMASMLAGCQYCVAHTGESAHNASVEDQTIAAVGQYETSPFFNEAERAALHFDQRAAAVPNAVTDEGHAA